MQYLSALSALPTSEREDSSDLQTMLDSIESKREVLRNIGRPIEHWDDIFVFFLTKALDQTTRKAWENSISDADLIPSYLQLSEFIENRIRALKANELSRPLAGNSARPKSIPSLAASVVSRRKLQSLVTPIFQKGQSRPCASCSGSHHLACCCGFLEASVEQRRDIAARLQACFNCLRPDHFANHCLSTVRCRECQERHHTLLYLSRKRSLSRSGLQASSNKRPKKDANALKESNPLISPNQTQNE